MSVTEILDAMRSARTDDAIELAEDLDEQIRVRLLAYQDALDAAGIALPFPRLQL